MVDEHFGISVVEFLAAGLVVIAHASGGPKDDILTPEDGDVGFLCSTADEYATAMEEVLRGSPRVQAMLPRAQARLRKFIGNAEFAQKFAAGAQ